MAKLGAGTLCQSTCAEDDFRLIFGWRAYAACAWRNGRICVLLFLLLLLSGGVLVVGVVPRNTRNCGEIYRLNKPKLISKCRFFFFWGGGWGVGGCRVSIYLSVASGFRFLNIWQKIVLGQFQMSRKHLFRTMGKRRCAPKPGWRTAAVTSTHATLAAVFRYGLPFPTLAIVETRTMSAKRGDHDSVLTPG